MQRYEDLSLAAHLSGSYVLYHNKYYKLTIQRLLCRCKSLGDGRESAKGVVEHAKAAVQDCESLGFRVFYIATRPEHYNIAEHPDPANP